VKNKNKNTARKKNIGKIKEMLKKELIEFFQPEEWIWLHNEWGYNGDYEFIYFK